MSVEEFFDRLDTMNKLGQDREIIAFATAHAPKMVSRLTGEEQMRLHGIVESALMAVDLEEAFSPVTEPDASELHSSSTSID